MQHLTPQQQIIESYLGRSRNYCLLALSQAGVDSIAFGHWLAIPSQQLLLVFRHQQCVAIDDYRLAA